MKRGIFALLVCLTAVSVAHAQFNDDNGGGPPGGGRDRGRGGRDRGDDGGGRGDRGGRFGRGGFPNVLFEALDTDKDQVISAAELQAATQSLTKLDKDDDGQITEEELRPDPADMANRMFTQMDQNGDGQITPDEAQGPASFMLRGADSDGDGAISKDEFAKASEAMRQRFQGGPGGGPGGPQGGPGGGPGGPGGFGGGTGGGGGGNSIMDNDRNGDGMLSPQEVPPQMMGMLKGGDRNKDGFIDRGELARIMQAQGVANGGGNPRSNGRP